MLTVCPRLTAGVRDQLSLRHGGQEEVEGRRLGADTASASPPAAPLESLSLPLRPRYLQSQPFVAGQSCLGQSPPFLFPPLTFSLLLLTGPVAVGWQRSQSTQIYRLYRVFRIKHLPTSFVAGDNLVESGVEVTAGTGLPTEVLPAVLERLDVPAAGLLPPAGDPHARPLALPGVRRQHLSHTHGNDIDHLSSELSNVKCQVSSVRCEV